MPASYLARHRPICTVLQEIRDLAITDGRHDIIELCNEAIDYAQRMSAKLAAYKAASPTRSVGPSNDPSPPRS